jgi:2-polyprenyl-6-methoxyphenol hydroxylase-like FAD-dependent oxidoreductase
MPDALDSLKAFGIEMSEEDGYPLQGIRFANSRHQVEARFPNGTGVGVRRTHLHHKMCEHAREVEVKLSWRGHATLLKHRKLMINGEETQYRWLIGAEGTLSQVRRWAGSMQKGRLASVSDSDAIMRSLHGANTLRFIGEAQVRSISPLWRATASEWFLSPGTER